MRFCAGLRPEVARPVWHCTLRAAAIALAMLAGGAGCGNGAGRTLGDPAPVASAPAAKTSAVATAAAGVPVTANELAGHWMSAQYGDAYFEVDGANVSVVYTYHDGRVLAALHGAVVVGWWTEAPTRRPADDAGDVEFTMVRSAGTLTLDGKWRYGTSGEFHTDWDLSKVDNAIPDDVRGVFADRSQFVPHP